MRPKLKLETTWVDWLIEGVLLLFIIGMFTEVFMYYPDLPQQIPTHYGADGEPDAFGGKSTIWIMASLSLVMYLGLSLLWRYPNIYNYPVEVTEKNAPRLYAEGRNMIRSVKGATVVLFLYISHRSIMVAIGEQTGLGPYMVPIMITFFIVLSVLHVVRMTRLS